MKFLIEGDKLIKYTGNDKFIKIPDNILIIEEACFKDSKIEKIDLNNVIEIRPEAFKNSNLKSLDLKNVKRIGSFSFSNCKNLIKVNLRNLNVINDYSFQLCKNLKKVIGNDVLINKGAFYDCINLKNVNLNILDIKEFAFYRCVNLKKINIENVKNILDNAFSKSGLKNILINSRIIGINAFSNMPNLKDIKILENVVDIKEQAFSNNKQLSNISVASLNAFYQSKNGVLYDKAFKTILSYPIGKKDLIFSDLEVSKINDYAFLNARNLIEINLPNVKSIGIDAFSNCVNLKKVSSNIKIKDEYFLNCNKLYHEYTK